MPNLRPLGCFLLVYFGVVLLVVLVVLVVVIGVKQSLDFGLEFDKNKLELVYAKLRIVTR